MLQRVMNDFRKRLEQRAARRLTRRRQVLASPQGVEVTIDGERLLAFCSNDYLGLAADPRLVEALRSAASRDGVGAGASHLISGHHREHHALEEELAEFVGAPRALLFSTGYMANLAVVGTLLNRRGVVIEDKLNHASLIDAARLSGAAVRRFPHADLAAMRRRLVDAPDDPAADTLIVTDGVFSMDGDIAALSDMSAAAGAAGARLLVDDAHGIGVLGAGGRGSLEHHGLTLQPPMILMGTLGKALGTFGAFVAAEAELIELLIQEARTYIYTTALPPPVAAATRAALRIVVEEPWRRRQLTDLVAHFRAGAAQLNLGLMPSVTPIQPLLLGSAARALAASACLREQGILVSAIRPPTVPENSARLRITFSAAHRREHIDRLLEALARCARAGARAP